MGEQSFLQETHHLYFIHIPIKFHENIPNNYQVMGCTRMKITQNKQKKKKKQSKDHNPETKKRKATIIACETSS